MFPSAPRLAFPGLEDFDGGHSGGGGGLDTHVGVFEDETFFGGDAESIGGEEEGFGMGLAALVISGADEGLEFVEEAEGFEGGDDGFAGAAGDDGEGDGSVGGFDDLKDFGYGGESVEVFVVEAFFSDGGGVNGHLEALLLVHQGDDVADGHSSEAVEDVFREGASLFAEGLLPGDVVERHGVGDGSVAVEEIGLEGAWG